MVPKRSINIRLSLDDILQLNRKIDDICSSFLLWQMRDDLLLNKNRKTTNKKTKQTTHTHTGREERLFTNSNDFQKSNFDQQFDAMNQLKSFNYLDLASAFFLFLSFLSCCFADLFILNWFYCDFGKTQNHLVNYLLRKFRLNVHTHTHRPYQKKTELHKMMSFNLM